MIYCTNTYSYHTRGYRHEQEAMRDMRDRVRVQTITGAATQDVFALLWIGASIPRTNAGRPGSNANQATTGRHDRVQYLWSPVLSQPKGDCTRSSDMLVGVCQCCQAQAANRQAVRGMRQGAAAQAKPSRNPVLLEGVRRDRTNKASTRPGAQWQACTPGRQGVCDDL